MTGTHKRFGRDQSGIAAVEFALIVPMLLLAYLGATDITQALAIDRKLNQVASTVSDLVAQEDAIDSAKVEAFFQSGIAIMRPFSFETTGLQLAIVEVTGQSTKVTGVADHNWSSETDINVGDSYPLPQEMLDLSDGRYVVAVSASYAYQPMFSTIFNATMPLEQRSMHVVRQDVDEFGFSQASTGGGGTPGGGSSGGEDTGGGGSTGGGGNSGGGGGGGHNGGWCWGWRC